MRLNLSIHGEWHEWELPNPLYGSSFPEWNAHPFPLNKKDGDFEFTATGWTYGESGWNLVGETRYRGKVVAHEITVKKAADATGNEGDPALMPTGERAWKVTASIVFGEKEPMSPERLVDFGDTRVPEDGEHFILPVPSSMLKGQQTFVALVGKGTVGFRDGVYSPQDAPKPVPMRRNPFISQRLEGKSWVIRGEIREPTFVMFETSETPRPDFASERLNLKCHSQDGIKELKRGYLEVTQDTALKRKLRVVNLRPFAKGSQIRIRSVRPEKFRWELLVPPPSATERSLAETQISRAQLR